MDALSLLLWALQVASPPPGPLDRLLAPLRGKAAPVAPATARVAQAAVDGGFSRYDRDADGRIDEAEFGRWMAALRPAGPGSGQADPAWTARAFRAADDDGSGALSRGELIGFIAGAVSWRLPPEPAEGQAGRR